MKNYTSPVIEGIDIRVEGVYAESGSREDQYGDWIVTQKEWSHDSGHHTDFYITFQNRTGQPSSLIKAEIIFGRTLLRADEVSGMGAALTINDKTLTFSYSQRFNPNESKGFSLRLFFDQNGAKCGDGQIAYAYYLPDWSGEDTRHPVGNDVLIITQ